MKIHPIVFRVIPILCMSLLASCSILGLRKQVDTLESYGAVSLLVSPRPTSAAPTYALAWTMKDGKPDESAGFQRVGADGLASMGLRMDNVYRVGAFTDENGNNAYDPGEPIGIVKDVRPSALSVANAKAATFKIQRKRNHSLPPGTVVNLPKPSKKLGAKIGVSLGEVVSIEEKRFASDAGGSGLWKPVNFLTENTLGIYLTEPFDPNRIPLVLVYGIGGSPQEWRYLVKNLDRKRYQVWFYHYPSGMRLERVARALATGLKMLKQQHGFAYCNVVAHSMGGLVSGAAIHDVTKVEGSDFVRHFVTISTPWGGHAAAKLGIRFLKKPVPSWLDVAPGSDFLKRLHTEPFPAGMRFDMIYGSIEDGPFYLKGENDGVVTVASETDPHITKRASSITHYPYGHVDILNKPDTLAKLHAILRN